jgi:hypothetical protein
MSGHSGFAMHETIGPDHFATKRFSNRLVAQAHAEEGNSPCRCTHEWHRDASFARSARPRGDHDTRGIQRQDLFYRQRIVTIDDRVGAELTGVLDQVIGKAVVVIEDEEHAVL